MICFHSWKDLLTLRRTRDHKRWQPNLILWKHCTCMVGRSISECVSHREDWNPLVDEKAVLRIIFNSLWPSELDFLIFIQGKLFSCFAFFENDLCGAGYKISETRPGIPARRRAPPFLSAGVARWVVALNLKASIIVIHQARFGVKIPLPPSCGMGMGPWIALENLHDSSPPWLEGNHW